MTPWLIQEQHNDPEILNLFQKSLDETETSSNPVSYYTKNGILMRQWRPQDVSVDDEWAIKHQIVVPKLYRNDILSLAHETPLSGHLGVTKTYNKVLNHLF